MTKKWILTIVLLVEILLTAGLLGAIRKFSDGAINTFGLSFVEGSGIAIATFILLCHGKLSRWVAPTALVIILNLIALGKLPMVLRWIWNINEDVNMQGIYTGGGSVGVSMVVIWLCVLVWEYFSSYRRKKQSST